MRTVVLSIVSATLAAAASTIGAAPGQTTATPGQMTQARVWVQNHDPSEAVPVDIRAANLDRAHPLRVQVVNGEAPGSVPPLPVQLVSSTWEYRTLAVTPDTAPGRALVAAGAEGWEVTGISWPTKDGTLLLLKRAR
jgi:hypothetical protein